ncbi:27267_t:CDS:2, partial [Racocetra persica]
KEVIISDGLKVKIRPEKQVIYGELSEIVLTNFCDSLEATLDQNGSYHLFPDFAKYQDFDELFNGRELTLMVCPEKLFDGESYSYRELLLEKVGELAKRNAERENKLNGQPPGKEKQDEKSAQRAVEEKNNEILQLKRRLELLEESRAEMVSAREGEIEELEKKLKNKNEE